MSYYSDMRECSGLFFQCFSRLTSPIRKFWIGRMVLSFILYIYLPILILNSIFMSYVSYAIEAEIERLTLEMKATYDQYKDQYHEIARLGEKYSGMNVIFDAQSAETDNILCNYEVLENKDMSYVWNIKNKTKYNVNCKAVGPNVEIDDWHNAMKLVNPSASIYIRFDEFGHIVFYPLVINHVGIHQDIRMYMRATLVYRKNYVNGDYLLAHSMPPRHEWNDRKFRVIKIDKNWYLFVVMEDEGVSIMNLISSRCSNPDLCGG